MAFIYSSSASCPCIALGWINCILWTEWLSSQFSNFNSLRKHIYTVHNAILELDNTSCASTSNNVDDDDSHCISDFGAGATYLETDKTPAEASTFDACAHFDLIEHFSNVMNDFVC
jgi:hypothetical protein